MLINELADVEFLSGAWDSLNKYNLDSHGLSGETIFEFRSNLEYRIPSISDSLINDKYHFHDTRAYIIPKDNGKPRPLQIPEITDRLVLKGIAILLEKELSGKLAAGKGVSFAYQKRLGTKDAILKMKEYYDSGYHYILEADIENFFPTVGRDKLLKDIFLCLKDSSLNNYIKNGINQKVGGLDKVEYPELFANSNKGIPQGNPLSPLFSNFYLAPFDEQMKEAGFALIRYADDFIVMCKTENEAKKAYKKSQEILEDQLNLKLYPLDAKEKSSKIVKPSVQNDFSFLSVAFDGNKLFPSKKCASRFMGNVNKICNQKGTKITLLSVLQKVNSSLDGWISTFSYTDVARYFEQIDYEINKQLLVFLNRTDWKLRQNSIGKIKGKYRTKNDSGHLDSGDCLSNKQRKTSGVPFCQDILKERTKSRK